MSTDRARETLLQAHRRMADGVELVRSLDTESGYRLASLLFDLGRLVCQAIDQMETPETKELRR
jgi:hypothetical protein